MVVRTQSRGCRITGLNVGADNVRHYFPKDILAIELQLEHLQIQCKLELNFWENQPKIQDPRLCDWLEFKYPYGKPNRPPVLLTMILSQNNSFRLQSMLLGIHARDTHASRDRSQLDIMEDLPAQPRPVRSVPPASVSERCSYSGIACMQIDEEQQSWPTCAAHSMHGGLL